MSEQRELSCYIQDMYNYCAIAAAVAVALSTAKEKSAEDYLYTLRDNFTAKAAYINQGCSSACAVLQDSSQFTTDSGFISQDLDDSSSHRHHEQKFTCPQQEPTVTQLQQDSQTAISAPVCSEVPDAVCSSDNFGADLIGDFLENLIQNENLQCVTNTDDKHVVARCDEQQDVRETAIENARFIYALIGLRFAAKKEAFVPASTVSRYLSMVTTDVAKNLSTSLLGNAEADLIADSNIASAFIHYHTQQTHEHLLQSVDKAVAALGTLILDKRSHLVQECFYSWENSSEHYVVDTVCSALDLLCDESGDSPEYTNSCIELVKSFLTNVMDAEHDEFVMWEQQCGMLLKLVGHRHVCGRVLNLLVENVKELAENVRLSAKLTTSECSKKMHRLASIQARSFYIFNLTEDLLVEYKKIHGDLAKKCRAVESLREELQDGSAVDVLWRNAYSLENDDCSKLRSSLQLISLWKDSLAQSAMTFTNHNARLLSVYAWSCIDLVKDLQQ